jgi:hypothetical protein
MNELKIFTIEKLKFTGKWVEFWFEEDFPRMTDEDSYHLSTKTYMLWEVVYKAGVYTEIAINGFKGVKTIWEKDKYNWELKEIL